jgi:hypothetical protein
MLYYPVFLKFLYVFHYFTIIIVSKQKYKGVVKMEVLFWKHKPTELFNELTEEGIEINVPNEISTQLNVIGITKQDLAVLMRLR